MATTGIYLLTSPSGKQYVGKSWAKSGIKGRLNSHKSLAKGCRALYNAIKKYGWDNFKKEIIHEISFETHGENWKKIISDTEDHEIRSRNTLIPGGYNLVVGFNTANIAISDETRERMSIRSTGENNPMFGKPRTDDVKEKLRVANLGKKHPPRGPEFCAKMSELNKGEKHHMFGKTHREETKKAISESLKGRVVTDETRAKLSKAHKGLLKPETGEKLYKKVEQWSEDGKTLLATFVSAKNANMQTGANRSSISQCANNKQKTAKGFIWKFAET